MSVKFLLFRGGFWGGGGKCRFYFYGRADFSDSSSSSQWLCKSCAAPACPTLALGATEAPWSSKHGSKQFF